MVKDLPEVRQQTALESIGAARSSLFELMWEGAKLFFFFFLALVFLNCQNFNCGRFH